MRVEILASTTSDNFFYLLEHDGHTALVDPIDAGQAVEALRRLDLELDLILNTHWHPDHVGGNQDVREAFPGARLVGPADEAELIEEHGGVALDEGVRGGDRVELGGAALEVLSTPGHTAGHVSFRVEGHLLSGDTIFSAGAGNCRFGGDPGTLYQTFRGALRELDGQLTIYPGHDYAERNLEFGLSILEQRRGADPPARAPARGPRGDHRADEVGPGA